MGECLHNGESSQSSLVRGIVSGAVGGLIGTIVMTQFQSAWTKAAEQIKKGEEPAAEPRGEEKEDATMKAAGKAASLMGRDLSHKTKKKLGPAVHYGFGTFQGAMYGMSLEAFGCAGGLVAGLAFGAALFGLADELAVPALGFSGKPTESPLPTHLYALAAHLVYGLSSEVARRGARASV